MRCELRVLKVHFIEDGSGIVYGGLCGKDRGCQLLNLFIHSHKTEIAIRGYSSAKGEVH